MVLIFAHHYDMEAKWLAQYLPQQCSSIRVKLVIAEALGIDYDITLSIKNNSSNAVVFFKDDTGPLACGSISFVINRLMFIDPIVWNKSDKKEKTYAMNEINAFFAAFIHSYKCPVVNAVEHGSLLGNNSGTFRLVKILKKDGMAIHPFVFEENENSFKLMEKNAVACLRAMCWYNKIFFPLHQFNIEFRDKIMQTLNKQQLTSTHELFFINNNAEFELIYISKSPALSVYGQPFLQYLSEAVNTPQPCY